jgi:hypothetical protein
MAAPTTYPLSASPRVPKLLAQIVRAKQTNKALLVERANPILKMLDGSNNTQAARTLRFASRYRTGLASALASGYPSPRSGRATPGPGRRSDPAKLERTNPSGWGAQWYPRKVWC